MLLPIIAIFLIIMGYVIILKFDENGDLIFLYLCIVAFVGVIVGSIYLSYKVGETSCEKKATAQGLEYKYGWWEGCLVKESDGNYIDYDRYRVLK